MSWLKTALNGIAVQPKSFAGNSQTLKKLNWAKMRLNQKQPTFHQNLVNLKMMLAILRSTHYHKHNGG